MTVWVLSQTQRSLNSRRDMFTAGLIKKKLGGSIATEINLNFKIPRRGTEREIRK